MVQPPSLIYVKPNEGPRISKYLAARGLLTETETPLVISMKNGDNKNSKKIVLDPDNGIIVTQDKSRKKRSIEENTSKATDDETTTTGN